MTHERLLYRKGVGMVVRNSQGYYFSGRRIQKDVNVWQMPQGGTEDGESLEQSMRRELYEETGIQNVRIIEQAPKVLQYDLPRALIPLVWNGQYCGQQQHWFLLEFTGQDSEIDLNAAEQREFCEWKWAAAATIVEEIIDFKKELYRDIFRMFNISLN